MSSIDDRYIRLQALERAIKWTSKDWAGTPDDLMDLAEKFRVFLAGEKAEEPKVELPKFKLPRIGDGYVYYQFNGADYILYRSDLSYGALAPSVERISLRHQREWRTVNGELSARQGLRAATDDYTCIPASRARELVEKYIKGSELV
jgi:hypothetical protein